jgi:8-oxo-dGTP diphosphatase
MTNIPHFTASPATIRIAAAIILDNRGRVLLVRKHHTAFFIQPGGKLQEGEFSLEALEREVREELGCRLGQTEFLGIFSAPAANEPTHIVEAALYRAEIAGEVHAAAEIEEVVWVEPSRAGGLPLAPLTRDHVLPLCRSRRKT